MTVCESCKQLCDGLGPYCWECQKEFEQYDEGNDECRKCGGRGEIEWDDDACSIQSMETCWVCKGSGVLK